MSDLYFYDSYTSTNPVYSFNGRYISTDKYCSRANAKYTVERKDGRTYIYAGDNDYGTPIYTFDGRYVYAGDRPSGRKLFTVSDGKIWRGEWASGTPMFYVSDHVGFFSAMKETPNNEKEKSQEPEKNISNANEQSKSIPPVRPVTPPINTNEVKFVTNLYFILLVILSPIALVYLSVTKPDFGVPIFSSVIIGTIVSFVFFIKEKKYKTIFLKIWLFSSIVMFVFTMFDSVSRDGFRLLYAMGLFIGSAFFVSAHSAIFAGLVYLIFPKINLNNIPNPTNKIVRTSLLLLIPVLIYLMISQYRQYLRKEAEWYDDVIPTNQKLSENYSSNDKQVLQPSPIANNSHSLSFQQLPTISVNYPTSSSFDYSPTYIPNVYPITENVENPTQNYSYRFNIGDRGYICAPGGVNLRSEPNINSEYIIKTMPYQSYFTVIGGPKIDNSTIWWQVNVDNEGIGWMSEGHDNLNVDYLLCILN